MTVPAITVLPTAPARTDTPATFNTRADAFLGALYSPFSTQMNTSIAAFNTDFITVGTNVTAAALSATNSASSATAAAASATAAAHASAASAWVSGTSYTAGDVVYSPIDFQSYRCILATSGTTDPSADTTYWVLISASAGGVSYVAKTATYTAADLEGVLADTSGGAFTVNLPASPSAGAQVIIADSGGAFGTNNLTTGRNSSTINGTAADLLLDIDGVSVQFVYDGSTWEVYAQVGGNGGSVVTLAGVQTLTNKTLTSPTLTTPDLGTPSALVLTNATGTLTSPTFVTPALGTPASGVLTNATGLPLGTGVTGTLPPAGVTGTAAILGANTFTALQTEAAGADIASATATDLTAATGNVVVITGTTTATSLTMTKGQQMVLIAAAAWPLTFHATTMNIVGGVSYTCAAGDRLYVVKDDDDVIRVSVNKQDGTAVVAASGGVSYDQNIQSADYTLVIDDAGKQIFHPSSDTIVRIWTIPANASVAFDIGTVVLFVNDNNAGLITLNITSDTMTDLNGTTGVMTVPHGSVITALKVTATKWLVWGQSRTVSEMFVALATAISPYIEFYPWGPSGFGTKFSDPSTLPTGVGQDIVFSPAGTEVAISHDTGPYVTVYPWSSSGFGTKFSDPSSGVSSGNARGCAFSPAGTEIVVGTTASPYTSAYVWSLEGFGTKFTNPVTGVPDDANGIAFSPDGTEIAFAHKDSPWVSAYPWSASGFGTKFSNPATLPPFTGFGAAFSPAGTELAIAHDSSPYVSTYPWSASGFGTKFSNPATLPTGTGNGVAFSPSGAEIAIAHATSPYVTAYPWSASGFGTKLADPATLPTGIGNDVAFSSSGQDIAIAHDSSPYVSAYPWSSSGFGTKYANPATLPTGNGNAIKFHYQ